jgi:hypothetical protein
MHVPNRHLADVPRAKITDYLLSSSHRTGRAKAFFFERMGFRIERWKELADALRQHVIDHEAVASHVNEYGARFLVDGEIKTPSGRAPMLRSVWIIPSDALVPQLVTAYPAKAKSA